MNIIKALPNDIKSHIKELISFNKCQICNKKIVYYVNNKNTILKKMYLVTCCNKCYIIYILDNIHNIIQNYNEKIILNTANFIALTHAGIIHIVITIIITTMNYILSCSLILLLCFSYVSSVTLTTILFLTLFPVSFLLKNIN